MIEFEVLPQRRRTVLIINSVLVGLAVFTLLVRFYSSVEPLEASLSFVLLLILIAIFQWCCAIYNIMKGSRLQLYYLIASMIYLIPFWIGTQSDELNESEFFTAIYLWAGPLLFAIAFCFILRIDDPTKYKGW